MNWEQAVRELRLRPAERALVKASYLEEDLLENQARFQESDEWALTLALAAEHGVHSGRVLDVGSGNGISAVNFALAGFDVVAIEPDPSETVGSGAIRWLKGHFDLQNLDIREEFAESVSVADDSVDMAYARQAMHHAADLDAFVAECARVLKPGGLLMTVRDHVVYDDDDKRRFLDEHPLHALYGGENAFRRDDYRGAMTRAGLEIQDELRYYDSPLNYYPTTAAEVAERSRSGVETRRRALARKVGPVASVPVLFELYCRYRDRRTGPVLDERQVPGRLYTYLAVKP
jgi:SAM-dependent methyltransferase